MIDVCMYLVGQIPRDGSLSYNKKFVQQRVPALVSTCLDLAEQAARMDADVHLILAVALKETGFTTGIKSRAGAVSVMGVMPQYCRANGELCTTPTQWQAHGIATVNKLTSTNTLCTALAKYNAGPLGHCEGPGASYARNVMAIYVNICGIFGGCKNT